MYIDLGACQIDAFCSATFNMVHASRKMIVVYTMYIVCNAFVVQYYTVLTVA